MYQLKNISKNFKDGSLLNFLNFRPSPSCKALSDFSLEFYKGDCVGMVGKNGSGKSTILKIISNLIIQDSGEIIMPPQTNISYVSGNDRSFFWRLTVEENLEFFSNLYGYDFKIKLSETDELIKKLKIKDLFKTNFMSLSHGQKKKISFLRSVIRDPDIFLFDEVTNSLDSATKNIIHDFLLKKVIQKKSAAIIWASHDFQEVNLLSNKIIVLNEGKIAKKLVNTKISDEDIS